MTKEEIDKAIASFNNEGKKIDVEAELIKACYTHNHDSAMIAMKRLKNEFDPNYRFCINSHGLVTNKA